MEPMYTEIETLLTLRSVLETNPKMSCMHIEETINNFTNILRSRKNFIKNEWSNQDMAILEKPIPTNRLKGTDQSRGA